MCVTGCHDMTLAVKVALNQTPIQPTNQISNVQKKKKNQRHCCSFSEASSTWNLCKFNSVIPDWRTRWAKEILQYQTPSFVFNPLPNKPLFLWVCSTSLLKTLWEKEKILVTSNFSFSHSVFYHFGELFAIFVKFKIVVCKVFQFGRVYILLFGKGLTLYHGLL